MLAMITDLKRALGDANVLIDTSEEDEKSGEGLFQDNQTAGLFRDGHDIVPGSDKFASSVCVTPGDTADVQKIVRLGELRVFPSQRSHGLLMFNSALS